MRTAVLGLILLAATAHASEYCASTADVEKIVNTAVAHTCGERTPPLSLDDIARVVRENATCSAADPIEPLVDCRVKKNGTLRCHRRHVLIPVSQVPAT